MQNSRLISLLYTLSKKEVREIKLFLASPFFNKRLEVSRLFDFMIESMHQHQFVPDKTSAFKRVAGKQKPYDDQLMRLWMSFLLKAIEKYLIHAKVFEDPVKTKLKLTEIYRQRNLPKHQERLLRELTNLQNKQPFRNASFYTDNFQIQLEQHQYTSSNRRMSELNLQDMSNHLDIAYFSQKLQQSCIALSHQSVYKTEYKFGLLDEIVHYLESHGLIDIPAIAVHYYGYLTLAQPEEANHFRAFKKALVNYSDQFPKEELGDLYILAINFCIKRYNAGDHQFLEDEFEIYQKGLNQDLFLKNSFLSRFTYRNVVTVGLVLKEFEWVENFIHEFKPKLKKDYRESMFSFNLAQLEYSRKHYDAALQLLQKSNYKDLLLNLAAKTVMLKIFYELDEFDLLNAHLDAMRTFIRRKNILAYHEENYVKLIYFTRKLMELNPFDRSAKKVLQEEIQKMKVVAEKGWLLERVES